MNDVQPSAADASIASDGGYAASTTGGPLSGLRVVEMAGIGPGPFACLLLAELGAEVVRVDRPGGGGPAVAASDGLNRSRTTIGVDLKHPQGREVVLRLVERADILIEGWRPGVAERLGIGPGDCQARNPRLVYGRMTGWGQNGPLAKVAGHDINYAALTGALHVSGSADKPRQAVNLVADFGGGALYLLTGVLAALHERQNSGRGQVVDAAMVDGAASLMTMIYGMHATGAWEDRREANLLDGGAPFYDTYRCADDRHVAVGAIEPQFYAALLRGLGVTAEGDQLDQEHWPAHRKLFADTFASRTRDEWTTVFEGTDACVSPVLGLEEAPHHPHMAARGVFGRSPAGDGHEPRVAPRFSRSPGLEPSAARRSGDDTEMALLRAGFSADEIQTLVSAGAVQQG
ncbi:CaiB/BaiF CoA transferase family protein [Nocardioides pacificus]